MSKTKQILILAIIAAAAAAGGLIAINSFSGSSVQANQGGRSGAQKWEYCAIISAGLGPGNVSERGVAVIRYFQAGGIKEETVEFVPDAGKRNYFLTDEALDKAINKLGDEGWEMVLKEPDTEDRPRTIFYFKRPKQ
jgi:hypothetical protein